MATLFIDYENGNDNWGGSSFAPLASGTDGRISSSTFSSATANFQNNGTLCNTKNFLVEQDLFISTAQWGASNANINYAPITPPSGLTFPVFSITENTATNSHYAGTNLNNTQYSITIGNSYTISCYAKSYGRDEIVIRFSSSSNTLGIRYNLSTGTISQSGSSATGTITSVGDGWYRLTLTATASSSSQPIFVALTDNTYTDTTLQSYTGNGTSGIYVTGFQLEAGTSATAIENNPPQYLSIFNGTSYVTYQIVHFISSTSLHIILLTGGTALANQSVDRQYFIGGRWKTINTGASAVRVTPGDDIRIMASPDPTLVGNATFTSSKAESTRTISSSTNASPIAITMAASHGYSTGDTVIITAHTTNTNANGTWAITVTGATTFTLNNSTGNGVGSAGTIRRINNCVVSLSGSVTENVASFGNRGNGRTAWTASANVTSTLDTTDTKEGDVSDSIAVGAAFTTGKAAYKATGTLNLSGYQQISFWIKQTAGTAIVDGDISLRLCSDTIGDTTVNTINIPGIIANTRWLPITVNLNSNLGSSIQSVALYVDADKGAQTFLISNIIACKSSASNDSLTLQSLIGKNSASEKWWAGIQSINGTRVIFDQDPTFTPISAASNTGGIFAVTRGYNGTSETVSLYKRETIKTIPVSASTTSIQVPVVDNGYDYNFTNLQFGFDRINMSNRTGETFFDGLNGWGIGLYMNAKNYIGITNVGFVRYLYGIQPQSSICDISNLWLTGNTSFGIYPYGIMLCNISNVYAYFNGNAGVFGNVSCQKNIFNNIQSVSNGSHGIYMSYCSNNTITNSNTNNNNGGGITFGHGLRNLVKSCTVTDNSTQGLGTTDSADDNLFLECTTTNNQGSVACGGHGTNYVKNCTLNETTEASIFVSYSSSRTIFINNDNSTNNYIHYVDNGLIYNTASVRYSNSGFAWALAPTSTARSSIYPLDLAIAKVAVAANSLVTIKAWVRRSNIALTMGLRVKGGQIAGVTNDITSYMSAAADTWEQVTISFTPTEIGVVEILAECYGGTTHTGYVDNITITQV